jgi:hypothetical protein
MRHSIRLRTSDPLDLPDSSRGCQDRSIPDPDCERLLSILASESLRRLGQRVARAQLALTVLLVALTAETAVFVVASDWNVLILVSPILGISAAWTLNLERQVRSLKPCRVRTTRYRRAPSTSDRY